MVAVSKNACQKQKTRTVDGAGFVCVAFVGGESLLSGGEGVPARAVYCSPRKAKLSTKTMTYELFFV